MNLQKSKALYKRAVKHIPGGVNSPVRFYQPYPFFTSHASGSKLYDVDGNAYIDYCLAYGPLFLGHAHPDVIAAVNQQLQKGTAYGTPSEAEVQLAETVSDIVPCVESLRLVNSGTEATMHAIRLARGYTRKDKIIKFEGCYHGAHDAVLVNAGSGAFTFGIPSSLGVTEAVAKDTIVLPFNNVELLEEVVSKSRDEISAVIVEPVVGNAGVILPKDNYLQNLRKITEENGILLIFDEVITGFRLALGGAQEYFGVEPDLITYGKILGGGFPMGAYGGKINIMENVAPLGNVYQAGTMSGNPISVTAGLSTLKVLNKQKNNLYPKLAKNGERISKSLMESAKDAKLEVQVNIVGSMFQVFFTPQPVINYQTSQTSNKVQFMAYQKQLMKEGVFIPPSQFETCFISLAHTDEDIDKTLEVITMAFKKIHE